MDWNCTLTEERLSDFLEGQLNVNEAAALTAHRGGCARCAELIVQVSGIVNQMHRLEPLEAPAGLEQRILRATLPGRAKKEGWRGWFSWVPLLWQPRFAVGIATVAACCVVVVQAGGVTPGKLRHADLNPVNMLRTMNRQAHLTYARGAKFVNELRVVYEIQSRLEPEPPAEQPRPRQQHDPKSHSTYPQQKSETHRGRREARESVFFAQDLPAQTLQPVDYLENGLNWSCP